MKSIKEIKAVRILAKPYMDWRWKKEHEMYLRTPDHFYLQTLRGIHAGKRCFIIGNGPSLCASDLDMLKGEYTFACNRIFNIFSQTDWRPTYYLSVDDKVLKEIQDSLSEHDLGHIFVAFGLCTLETVTNKLTKIYNKRGLIFRTDSLNLLYDNKQTYFSEDISNHFCDGGTVTFDAIQLAVYMGFKEIYLIGVDHHYSVGIDASGKLVIDPAAEDYFDHKKYVIVNKCAYEIAQYSYEIAREYCDTHDVVIRNATRGGKLEVFERVDFDSLFSDDQ